VWGTRSWGGTDNGVLRGAPTFGLGGRKARLRGPPRRESAVGMRENAHPGLVPGLVIQGVLEMRVGSTGWCSLFTDELQTRSSVSE
jgi:hypothetical protein